MFNNHTDILMQIPRFLKYKKLNTLKIKRISNVTCGYKQPLHAYTTCNIFKLKNNWLNIII